MADVESDEETTNTASAQPLDSKRSYTKATRGIAKKPKLAASREPNEEADADEVAYEDDEEYYAKFMSTKKEEQENEMDMLKRQLQLEKEEAERAATEKQKPVVEKEKAEVKTRVDPDGTVYEWDPVIRGWFPKVSCFPFFPPPISKYN